MEVRFVFPLPYDGAVDRMTFLVDGKEYEMNPGDFIAFPTPSVPHLMTNPNEEDLVYLMGGERKQFEVADFPTLDKRMIRRGSDIEIYKLSEGKPFDMPE
jgi:uncharacterized cupin superfamily protein